MNTIISSLQKVFAPYDEQTTLNHIEWAKGRVAAIKEYKQSEEYKAKSRNIWAMYDKLFAIAGGKTWYNLFNNNTSDAIEKFMVKNSKATFEKRNLNIAKKLEKAGVKEVISEKYVYNPSGFEGVFVVETDQGNKTVTITTIVAGGHNIQCVHNRVLVKVK